MAGLIALQHLRARHTVVRPHHSTLHHHIWCRNRCTMHPLFPFRRKTCPTGLQALAYPPARRNIVYHLHKPLYHLVSRCKEGCPLHLPSHSQQEGCLLRLPSRFRSKTRIAGPLGPQTFHPRLYVVFPHPRHLHHHIWCRSRPAMCPPSPFRRKTGPTGR